MKNIDIVSLGKRVSILDYALAGALTAYGCYLAIDGSPQSIWWLASGAISFWFARLKPGVKIAEAIRNRMISN